MASGFTFGAGAAQQPQQQTTSLFGTPTLGTSTANTGFSFGNPAPSGGRGLFGTTPVATSTTATGFSFSTPSAAVQPQQQQSTGFSLTGGLGAPATSTPATGFSFGTPSVPTVSTGPVVTTATAVAAPVTGTSTLGGLGGIPISGGPRISSLALGADPATGWSARNENRAVQELPVPPEVIAAVEELKNHIKNQKSILADLNRMSELDIDTVADQIEEVRMGITELQNTIHKQELEAASIVTDMQELTKDMDLLAQSKDMPTYSYGTTNVLIGFMFELLDKYAKRMTCYKLEIERAEFSLQTMLGSSNIVAKDLWDSLASTKDTIVVMAASIQELNEEVRSEITQHRSVLQVCFSSQPKPWVTDALTGSMNFPEEINPLDRVLSQPPKARGSSSSLENAIKRTYAMFNRPPALMDSRMSASSEALLRTPVHDFRSAGYNSPYHPSAMGSYVASTSPQPGSSLKRTKK